MASATLALHPLCAAGSAANMIEAAIIKLKATRVLYIGALSPHCLRMRRARRGQFKRIVPQGSPHSVSGLRGTTEQLAEKVTRPESFIELQTWQGLKPTFIALHWRHD
jgi:hypothetical protein